MKKLYESKSLLHYRYINFYIAEHMQLVKEEIVALSDQCKVAESHCRIAEKEKKDAETRLEVLTKFFQEKEAERQK